MVVSCNNCRDTQTTDPQLPEWQSNNPTVPVEDVREHDHTKEKECDKHHQAIDDVELWWLHLKHWHNMKDPS